MSKQVILKVTTYLAHFTILLSKTVWRSHYTHGTDFGFAHLHQAVVCIGVSPPPLSCQAPPLNLQTVQAPFLGPPPIYVGFLLTSPRKGKLNWYSVYVTLWKTQCAMHFILRLQQMHTVFLLIFLWNLKAHVLAFHYVLSVFISFGPKF